MRATHFLLATLKETPADAEVISHQLMLRAGLIRKLTSGNYTWLPMGLRVLNKVIDIVRKEMNKSGALEVLMPSVQPAELWRETGRYEKYGPELLRFKDRHDRECCYGPTHEEVITDIARRELHSYKQLPLNLYQIQTKFRDEIRPRFGVMRGREFIMKDAYSFHDNETSLKETYQIMYETYQRIFTRMGLNFRAVQADTGSIGGSASHEFQVLAQSGEDLLAISNQSEYAANIELAEAVPALKTRAAPTQTLTSIKTPDCKTIESVCTYLQLAKEHSLKAILVEGANHPVIALFLRGDHELNTVKAQKHPLIKSPLTFASEAAIKTAIGCEPGFIGPVGLTIPVLADRSASVLSDACCGANTVDTHYTGFNWGRDCAEPEIADLRNVVAGDASPDGKGQLSLIRGIEVGHIFQLGTKYSEAMNATVLNPEGHSIPLIMGCYGLGVTRVVAAAIEQHHDEFGIIWPDAIAPFHIAVIPINLHKSPRVQRAADELHELLESQGFEVLLDDRKERPGFKFSDMDLIGIPHRLILSERGLDAGTIEYKHRTEQDTRVISMATLIEFLSQAIHKT